MTDHGWLLLPGGLRGIDGIQVVRDVARYSEGIPVARIAVDEEVLGRSAADIAATLAGGDPGIRVTQVRDWFSINPQFLEPGDLDTVTTRLRQVLAA